MKLLLIGSGGREHSLAWALAKSPKLTKLFAAPGKAGISFCRSNAVELVVVGPEAPLVAGLVDDLDAAGIKSFGPTKAAAQLEGSKAFTKGVCDEASIPTAAYGRFTNREDALAYLRQEGAPIVVKADGLAAGKGVVVAMTPAEAEEAVTACFDGSFGDAGAEVVIEEFLEGEEASFFVLSDGVNALPLATAQDHKRAQHIKLAMRHVDHAHDPKHNRQPHRCQRQYSRAHSPLQDRQQKMGAKLHRLNENQNNCVV